MATTALNRKIVSKIKHLSHTKRVTCAFCKGTGKDPFGQLYPGSTCQVCSGRKKIYVSIPHKTCAYCHGTGVEFSMQNTCTACMGRGVISLKNREKRKKCEACGGSGMDNVTTRPCLSCRGLGEV